MTAEHPLDSQVILLLCSHLALRRDQDPDAPKPYAPAEWNRLAKRIWDSPIGRPGAILEWDNLGLKNALGLDDTEALRILRLLGRGGQLAIELERLADLGIWALTRADPRYPLQYKQLLGASAPPVLFGAGSQHLLSQGLVAIAGSRDVDEAASVFAVSVGDRCGNEQLTLVSGMARGIDTLATRAVLQAGGTSIGILADSLERTLRSKDIREGVQNGRLTLLTAQHPRVGFSVQAAFSRNKLVYCLAKFALIVSASEDKGGTRGGALEVLKHGWAPLFVRRENTAPKGNERLIDEGGIPLEPWELQDASSLVTLLETKAKRSSDQVAMCDSSDLKQLQLLSD